MQKTAVVTGANRGLGYATAQALKEKGFDVLFASRHPEELKSKGLRALPLDVSDLASIQTFAEETKRLFPHLDVLVNNAGILLKEGGTLGASAIDISQTFTTNTLGPFLITQALWPLLLKSPQARVVNVSSGMGQLSEMDGGYPGYRISKTALNAVTRVFAAEASSHGGRILVNSVCPGWVKTDMGGPGASRQIEEGISGIVWAALLPEDGPNGGFFRDGKRLDW